MDFRGLLLREKEGRERIQKREWNGKEGRGIRGPTSKFKKLKCHSSCYANNITMTKQNITILVYTQQASSIFQ